MATRAEKRCLDVQVGWVSTWSSYSTYKRQHADGQDPLPPFQEKLMAALGTSDLDASIQLTFPIFMILGKQPAK